MINRYKPISISLSPNVQKDDVFLALRLLFQPQKWRHGGAIKEFEEVFANYLGVKYAVSFNSGRSSLFAILKSLNLEEGSDVLLQAFTCNAVPNPVLWAKLNPVYVDCKEDFNVDIEDLKTRLRDASARQGKIKVLIVQHTFGLPANMDELTRIAKENNLIVIEDCAHALGAEYKGQKVGTFGDAAFFSFSRDKVISCVYGGMAVTNSDQIGKRLKALQEDFGMPSSFWVRQQILHPILLYFIILPLYNFLDLGKIFLVISQHLHFLSKAVSWQEKRGLKPDYFPKALPNALAAMALHQFNKLEVFYKHRKKLAEFYAENLMNTSFTLPDMQPGQSFLRFAVTHHKAHEILYEAWHKENILLGDWYRQVIDPHDTNLSEMKYESGMCPNAQRLAKITLNLPTHINISLGHSQTGEAMNEAKRIVDFLKKYA